jgi:hypothetical protein
VRLTGEPSDPRPVGVLAAADAPRAATEETRKPDANGQIEPDNDIGAPEHNVAQPFRVRAVYHPSPGCDDRFELRAQLVIGFSKQRGIRGCPDSGTVIRQPLERCRFTAASISSAFVPWA